MYKSKRCRWFKDFPKSRICTTTVCIVPLEYPSRWINRFLWVNICQSQLETFTVRTDRDKDGLHSHITGTNGILSSIESQGWVSKRSGRWSSERTMSNPSHRVLRLQEKNKVRNRPEYTLLHSSHVDLGKAIRPSTAATSQEKQRPSGLHVPLTSFGCRQ